MDKDVKILCTICARGGSQGVPGKNIRKIQGKPLICYTIEMAKKVSRFTKVIVSTDSAEIAEISKKAGADVPFIRPYEMATATVSKFPALRHAVSTSEDFYKVEFDYIVDLDPTSPLRNIQDIDNCIDLVLKDSVSNVITAMKSRRSPYFNLVEKDHNDRVMISKTIHPAPTCRQDSPQCYDMNASIYAWKKHVLMNNEIPIFLDDTELYVMPEERSIDIDSELDMAFVEYLVKKKSEDINL